MSESTETYKVKGSRVYGNGQSYNVTNNITAEKLACTLNKLTNLAETNHKTDQQLDKINKQIIQLKLSINTLQSEIERLTELME